MVIGDDTSYNLIAMEGLEPTESRVAEYERAEDHGSFVYSGYSNNRTVTLKGDIYPIGAQVFAERVQVWRGIFGRSYPSMRPLTFKIPGEVEKRIYCVPVRRNMPVDLTYQLNYTEWEVQLITEDPRIYAEDESSQVITPVASGGGLDPSVDFDASFGGASGGIETIQNTGIHNTPFIARIDGPFTDASIHNLTTGQVTRVTMEVESGHYAEIDYAAKTVKYDGTTSRYNALPVDNVWWLIEPGAQDIQFNALGASGSTQLTLTWRDAWI